MLINLSNHPSDKWDQQQLKAAKIEYGKVIDLQFPNIPPEADLQEVRALTDKYTINIKEMMKDQPNSTGLAVHIMGEHTFLFNMLEKLKLLNIKAIASTTERKIKENPDRSKVSEFKFIRFREYY